MSTHQEDVRHESITDPSTLPSGAVVVGIDTAAPSAALDWAIDHAVAERRPLVLAHAAGPTWGGRTVLDPGQERDDLLRASEATLGPAARRARHRAGNNLRLETFVGISEPEDLLVGLSARASLVVLGSHGRGPIGSLLLGSVGVAVADRAACPVVVHRPTSPGVVRQGVLVGIDATEHSRATLEMAFRMASAHRLPLTVVHTHFDAEASITPPHVVTGEALAELDDSQVRVAEAIAGLREDHPDVHTTIHIARGRPVEAVLHLARRMNLVVVGRHHGQRRHVLAGTATSILEHATCAVVVVPDTGPPR